MSEIRFLYQGHQIVVVRSEAGEDRFFLERGPMRWREIDPSLSASGPELVKYAGGQS